MELKEFIMNYDLYGGHRQIEIDKTKVTRGFKTDTKFAGLNNEYDIIDIKVFNSEKKLLLEYSNEDIMDLEDSKKLYKIFKALSLGFDQHYKLTKEEYADFRTSYLELEEWQSEIKKEMIKDNVLETIKTPIDKIVSGVSILKETISGKIEEIEKLYAEKKAKKDLEQKKEKDRILQKETDIFNMNKRPR